MLLLRVASETTTVICEVVPDDLAKRLMLLIVGCSDEGISTPHVLEKVGAVCTHVQANKRPEDGEVLM